MGFPMPTIVKGICHLQRLNADKTRVLCGEVIDSNIYLWAVKCRGGFAHKECFKKIDWEKALLDAEHKLRKMTVKKL